MPAFDSGDDTVRTGGPDEGLWLCVVLADEAAEGGLEVDAVRLHPVDAFIAVADSGTAMEVCLLVNSATFLDNMR